jgi:hypothetical protein
MSVHILHLVTEVELCICCVRCAKNGSVISFFGSWSVSNILLHYPILYFRLKLTKLLLIYDGRLKSSWTHLITPSRNFVEVRWRSLFRSTSLGKRCTSYNASPTSRKRAADRRSLRNFLPRISLLMVEKAQKSHGARSELNFVFGLEKMDVWNPIRTSAIQSTSRPMRFLGFSNHEKGAPRQEISKWPTREMVGGTLLAKGGTSKKETVTAPPQSSDSE